MTSELRCHTACRAGSRWKRPRDEWELDLRVPKSSRERRLCPLGSRSSWGTDCRASWSPGPSPAWPHSHCIGLLCTSHLQDLFQHLACISHSGCHQRVTQGHSEGLMCVSRGGTKASREEMPPRASGWSGSSIPAAPPPPLQGCTSGDAGPLPPLGADCRSRPSLAF